MALDLLVNIAVTRHLSWALALLMAACGGESDDPASQANDIVDGEPVKGLSYAVLVDAQLDIGVGECSGALIAPRLVLTAGHCVHSFSSWVITAPYAEGQIVTSSRGETFDWQTPADQPKPDMHDVGLIHLDEPIALDAYPTLAKSGAAKGKKVRYIGRVLNGESSKTGLFIGDAVRTRDGAEVGWPFTFATSKYSEHGDSGGPVTLSGDAQHIVGVDSGGSEELDIQLFARVDLLRDWIAERVAER